MRLVRRHGKAMLLHQKWKLGGALAVGAVMLAGVAMLDTYAHLDTYFGLSTSEATASKDGQERRLEFYPNDYVIGKYEKGSTKMDFDKGEYKNAPAGNKVGIIVHIIGVMYMLVGLNTVCDIYFCGALDEMVDKWEVKPDVAGATFMAAGGSAPELFTSLIGVFVESDVGFGTIVGSAVFNVLAVIGCCGMVAQEPIQLTWWPLFRDCSYYIFGLCLLAIFSYGKSEKLPNGDIQGTGEIKWYEALILFLAYCGYCTIMVFNERLEAWVRSKFDSVKKASQVTPISEGAGDQADLKKAGEGDAAPGPPEHHEGKSGAEKPAGDSDEKKPAEANKDASVRPKSSIDGHHETVKNKHTGHHISEHHLRRIEHKAHKVHHHHHLDEHGMPRTSTCPKTGEKKEVQPAPIPEDKPAEPTETPVEKVGEADAKPEEKPAEKAEEAAAGGEEENESVETDDVEALMKMPEDMKDKIAWILCIPIYAPLYYLVPRPGPKLFLATFGIALLFIAMYSYFLVYCVTMFQDAILGGGNGVVIVMSFTLLAAGTSIPDLVSSMAVARAGEGDMAVSSSIGSNIFDILVGLPIPWLIKIGIVEGIANGVSDYGVRIKSPFIALYVFLLLFMVFMVVVSIKANKWTLNKFLGLLMGSLYMVFLCVVLPLELINEASGVDLGI